MPRARNESTGPEANAFDEAVRALNRAEKAFEAAREKFHEAFVAAAGPPPKMGLSEAARRSGYSREYLSKLYTKITGRTVGQWQHTARDLMTTDPIEQPRKATGKTARDLMSGGRPRKAAPAHDDPA